MAFPPVHLLGLVASAPVHRFNWFFGWSLLLAAFLTGIPLGLHFYREDFWGGYTSFRRRIVRLGHVALAALGIVNVLFSLSPWPVAGHWCALAGGISFAAGGIAMPAVCFLAGWRPGFRHLFFVPVICLISAVIFTLLGPFLGGRIMNAAHRSKPLNIGFLAMSGVRSHDKKLLELGLTLPGFVDRSKVIAQLPSLGLLYLAACTPPGHRLRYFEAESDGAEAPALYSCDLVAISTFSAQIFEAYAIADRLRAAGVKVAMGGLHVSVQPDEAAQHADYVIVGEGENIWPAVVEAATRGEGPRIFRSSDFAPVDVADLPVPRYDLLDARPYNRFTVQTSRGCPWRCDFCASTVMLSQRYRKRPVEHVIRDILAIDRIRAHPFIEFADDNTFVDKAWGKELCRQLIPLKLKWFTETDISVADDPELLDLMREAGCRQVLIGLESPKPAALEGVEMHSNVKARWAAHYADKVREIQSHGITVNGCFILGLDAHGPEIFQEVLEFARDVPLFEVQITVLTAFPGTPLYARLLHEGRILEPGRWELCTLFDVNHTPKGMTPQQLRDGLYWLGERLYSEECTQSRRRPFFEEMRKVRA